MPRTLSRFFSLLGLAALFAVFAPNATPVVYADTTAFALCTGTTPNVFSQNWSNAGLITANDNWSGVPSIIGYLGDGVTGGTGVDPRTLTSAVLGAVDVIANQNNPNTLTDGGVAEFDLTNDVVALQGSGTADAPSLIITLNNSGTSNTTIAYTVRDIDGSADNATQQFNVQYRIGISGGWINVPGGYIADASVGPTLTQDTPVAAYSLPSNINNAGTVQLRFMTTNASGNDEWLGVDDIVITPTCNPDPCAGFTPTPYILPDNTPETLRTAIECANANGTADIIDFNGQTVTLTDSYYDYDGATGLPRVDSELLIRNGTITRSGSNEFRLLQVGSAGILSLHDMTLTNGGGASYPAMGGNLNANSGSSLTIWRSSFTGASVSNSYNAGGIFASGTFVMANSRVQGNISGRGGGMALQNGPATITNSVISGNVATSVLGGGAMYLVGANFAIINSTITGNYATASGATRTGGILSDVSGADLILRNSILWGNTNGDATAPQIVNDSTFGSNTVSNSIVQGGQFGALNSDPLFTTPLTPSATPSTAGNFQVLDVSPAIDAGANGDVAADTFDADGDTNLTEDAPDYAGNTRRVNDTGVTDTGSGTAPIVDLGAYEKQTNSPDPCLAYVFPYTLTGNTPAELIEAIECANANGTADTIDLNNQTVTLTDSYASYTGATGLPQITTQMTLRNGTITRSGSNQFRLLAVGAAGNLTLNNVIATNGYGLAPGNMGGGGAIYNLGALNIVGGRFSGNYSALDGGAIHNDGGALNARYTVFSGNSANTSIGGVGGGIGNSFGVVTLSNVLISGNLGVQGAGIYNNNGGTLTLNNSTIAGNSTNDQGGGLHNENTAVSVVLNNTIISGNESSLFPATSDVGGSITNNASLVGGSPSFVAPLDASATAPTTGGDYRLADFSPAIDAGDNSLVPGIISTDLNGNPRYYNDTGVTDTGSGTAPIVDMGAYEKQTNSNPCAVITFPYTLPNNAPATLITAIECANANGAGADVIDLNGQTFTLTASYATVMGSNIGLPEITTTMTIRNGTITRSSAELFRFFLNTSTLRLYNLTLSNGDSQAEGGAIYNFGSTSVLELFNSRVIGNTGTLGGAIFIPTGSNVAIINTLIAGNLADAAGGGVHNRGLILFTNSTITGNFTTDGIEGGGGIANNGGSIVLDNTIVYGNEAASFPATNDISGPIFLSNNSLVGVNPSFIAPLDASNTAPTTGGDYRLADSSIAIDAGDNNLVLGGVTTDIVGNPRFYNDTGVADTGSGTAPIVDMGAYEKQTNSNLCAAITFPYTLPNNLAATLITAIECANANGASADVINLNSQIVTLTASYADYTGATGLPQITTPVTLESGVITRSGGAPQFRLLNVGAAGNLTLDGVTVSGGSLSSSDNAGAIFNSGTLNILNSTITNNSAGFGGAIYNNGAASVITITTSTLSSNSATQNGGFLMNDSGSATITNSTVSGNSSSGISGNGAIYNFEADLDIIDSIFATNSSTTSVGAVQNFNGTINIANSVFAGNSATNSIGAVTNNAGGIMTITNSRFTGNSAGSASGALFNNTSSTLTITNSTFAGNNATTNGGINISGGSTATITNSIIWGNNGNTLTGATITYSIIEGGFTGTGNLNVNPLFVAPVGFASAPNSSGNYRLQDNSPAVDAGSNAAVPVDTYDLNENANTTEDAPDLDFDPRRYDDTGVADTGSGTAPIVDMGAYEKQTDTPVAAVDFCNLQFPTSFTLEGGSANSSPLIYGRIYEDDGGILTSAGGAHPSIVGQVGYGPLGSDPTGNGSWTWVASTFNTQIGNDDEYQGSFFLPSVVTSTQYSYTTRFSIDGGTNFTYCDSDGNGTNSGLSFSTASLGTMTVLPSGVNYCALQFPTSFTVASGSITPTIFGQINEDDNGVLTSTPGADPNVIGQVGYGPLNSNPTANSNWAWFATSYNIQTGNDDEYQGSFTAPVAPTGTQLSYTYRFSVDGGASYTYCDTDDNGTYPGLSLSTAALGTMTISPGGSSSISINDVSLNEGDSGTTNFVFTVSLNGPTINPVTFDIATADNTATVGNSDYANNVVTGAVIPIGQTTYTFTVVVNGDVNVEPNETFFVNLTNVTGTTVSDGQGQGTITNDDAAPEADLSITKTDGVTTATPGGSVTYTITASNAGPSNANGATVADTFPAVLTGTWTCVGAGGGTCTASGSGNINDSVNLPAGGSVTYTVSATISASATGTLSNTATVTVPGGVTDPTPANNSATDSDTLTPSANLGITKTDGVTTATPGGSVTYTITASNAGPSNANGATVADTFPAVLTGTWTCVGAGGGTCTASGSGNINDTVNLPVGGSVTYTVSATISAAATGTLSNTATVTVPGGITDPNPANNSATDTDTLTPSANLGITKTDGVTTATPGGSVTYTITASNAGPSNANGATVADTFPAVLTGTWTCVGAGGGTCTASGSGNINDTVNLPVGGSVTYTVSATISAAATGTLSNTATVTVPGGVTDPTPANNSATDTDTLTPPTPPTISINDVALNEGNSGTTNFIFTVSLNTASASTVTFDIGTADNTATVADGDYAANSATGGVIPAGETSTTFTVVVNGDATFEPNETFFVNLTNIVGATVGNGQGTGTIVNDDVDPCMVITFPYTLAGNTPAELIQAINCANLNGPSADTISLNGQTVTLTASYTSAYGSGTGLPEITTPVVIQNGTITRSSADLFRFFIYSGSSSLTLNNITLSNGNPEWDGGAIWGMGSSTLTINNSRIIGNYGNYGGAIFIPSSGTAVITNTLLSGNRASSPGGAIRNRGNLTLNNSTIAGNFTTAGTEGGGGIANNSGTVVLNNSIVYGNEASSFPATNDIRGTYTANNSLVGVNPSFVNLLDAGDTAPTTGGDYRLAAFSVAIDAGSNSLIPGGVTTDLDGSPRRVDDTGVADTGVGTAPIVDIGAYERQTNSALPQADLNITKTDGVTTAVPGGSVTYTIVASNAGPDAVTGATVADTFPAVLTGTWTCVGAGGGTCTAAGSGNISDTVNLPVGGSVTYTVNATISAAATGTLSNTATVSSAVTDPNPANNSATDTDTLTPQADLAITKTDGVTSATPGGSVTYTITASNAGPSNVTGATVADTFPAVLTGTWTCVGAGGGTCTAAGSGNINDSVNLPAGSSVTYTVSATISASATGTLSNTATVSSAVTDPNPANNSATDTDTLTPQADLNITKTDGVTTATPGGSVTYTITASNAGPSSVTGATVADTFPAVLTGTWTCVGAGGGTCTAAGSGNISDTVNLPAGGSVTYTVSATISASATGTLTNTATVTAPGGVTDPTPANNSATDTDTLTPQADLAITKTDGVTTATPGGSVTYTITASNAGPSNASGATVADTFPAVLTGTWTCVGAGGGTCTASGSGNINDTVNLPAGGSVTYTVSATISASATGTLTNTATVAAPGGVTDPTPANNSATDTDTLTPQADLAITKTDGVTTATPGGSVTYTITASNAGPSSVTGATVADTFPAVLTGTWTCVGAGGGTCTTSGSGNINDTVTLPAGGSVTYTVSATISAAATGTLSNTATVTSAVADPTSENNSATDTDTLTPSADLSITKTDGVTTATPGGSVTYTITASNAGPSSVTSATVADTFPAVLTGTWTCVGAGGGTCTASGSGNINDTVNLPAGGSVTYTVSAAISASATGTLTNTATVAAPGGVTDPTPANNSATDTDTLTVIVETNLLINGSFETATATTPKKALKWQTKAPSVNNDRRVCKPEFVSDGSCAYRFRFNGAIVSGTARSIKQVIKTPAVNIGDTLTFTLNVRANNLVRTGRATVTVYYADATREVITVTIPSGTYAYTEFTDSLTLTKAVNKIAVVIDPRRTLGTFYVDDVSLNVTSGLPPRNLLTLPAAPDGFRR